MTSTPTATWTWTVATGCTMTSTPTATWKWTCDKCGERYPAEGLYAVKSDAERHWKWHRNHGCATPLSQVLSA